MSLYGAMFSGVSALNAQSQALGMISDNISNVNTVGYKTTKASFATLVTRSSPNFHAPGGVRSSPIQNVDRQGLLQASANATDVAISGDGFFVVTDTSSPTANDTRYYTRAGQFSTDTDGYLKSPSGYFLQGWATDSTGAPLAANTSVLTSLQPVRVSTVSGSAVATSQIDIGANLPASAAVNATSSTNVQIFDSLGVAHDVTLTWTKTGTNAWTLTANAPDATPAAGTENTTGGPAYSVDVVFNSDGTPLSFDGGTTPPALVLTGWTSGASAATMAMNLGTAGPLGTAQANGITQFSSSYSTTFVNQNGVQFGNFFGTSIDENGLVTALFDNGQTLPVYKLPVATFPNPNGLGAKSGTIYSQSGNSGGFVLRDAGTANAGKIVPSSLEASTSDLADEFTNMIVTQRAYSASTRVITTADEMLDELIRIKR
jgi:flagellar hook protein FlgE